MTPRIVLAMTGASGAPYAVRLLEVLANTDSEIHLTISSAGRSVIRQELRRDVDLGEFDISTLLDIGTQPAARRASIRYYHYKDFMAPMASGSFLTAGMVVCPCSGSTLGAVANGTGNNLIHRAAEVHLKEQRKLILVTRETPLSRIQIENMKCVVDAGGTVLPASPGFYHGAESIQDLIDFVVARICDQLGIEHGLIHRWGS